MRYRMREGGTLLSYWPYMADESEANAVGNLDTRSESRNRAFDHHDMLDTWMRGAVAIGLLCTYFTLIQVIIAVEGQTDCYDTLYYPTRSNTQRVDLFRWTPCCMVLSSSTNFIKDNINIYTPTSFDQKGRTSLVNYRSEKEPKRNLQAKATNRG